MASLSETSPQLTTSASLQTPSPLNSCTSSRRESRTSELTSVLESTAEETQSQGRVSQGRVSVSRASRTTRTRASITRFLLPTVPSREASLVSRKSWFSVFPGDTSSVNSSRLSFSTSSVRGGQDEKETIDRLAAAGVRISAASSFIESEPDGNMNFWLVLRSARLQVWLFLEEPFGSLTASFVSVLAVLIIFGSVAHGVFVFEKTSMSSALQDKDNKEPNSAKGVNEWIDILFNLVFCADWAMRLWAFPLRSRFLTQPKNAIDTMCILPFVINEALGLPSRLPVLSFLRWLSAYETYLRLLKLARYFWGWQLLFRAIWDSAKALVIPFYFLVLIVVLGSCTLFVFEAVASDGRNKGESSTGDVDEQLCEFGDEFCNIVSITNLPDAIHFCTICILSMSTGPFYGMQASSWGGQATVCVLMVLGMTFMAMPISIVGNCFAQTWFDQDRIVLLDKLRSRLAAQGSTAADLRDVFDEVDIDGSGAIDISEFQDMIRACHLRIGNAKIRRLFRSFDIDGDGVINFTDFSLVIYPDLPLEEAHAQAEQLDTADNTGNTDRSSEGNTDRSSERNSSTQSRKSAVFGRLQPRASEGSGRSSTGKVSSSVGSVHSVKLWGSKHERTPRSKKCLQAQSLSASLQLETEGVSPSVSSLTSLPEVVARNTNAIPTVNVFPDGHGRSDDECAQLGMTSDFCLSASYLKPFNEVSRRSSFRSMRSGNSSFRLDPFDALSRPDPATAKLEIAFSTMIQKFERKVDNLTHSLTQPVGPSMPLYGQM